MSRSVVECGGKRSATPLLLGRAILAERERQIEATDMIAQLHRDSSVHFSGDSGVALSLATRTPRRSATLKVHSLSDSAAEAISSE